MAGEKRVKITPIDADYERACMRLCFKKWSDIKAEARKMAAERMLEANHAKVKSLLAKVDAIVKGGEATCIAHHAELMRMHAEVDRIWAEDDALSRIAFPSAYGDSIARAAEAELTEDAP